MQGLVTLGELLQVLDGGGDRVGVAGGVGSRGVEQAEHGPPAGCGVLPRGQQLWRQGLSGGAELVEQDGGLVQHRHQGVGVAHRIGRCRSGTRGTGDAELLGRDAEQLAE